MRAGQRRLAEELTTLVHGSDQTEQVIAASQALFGRGDLGELDAATLDAALAEVPTADRPARDGPTIVDLLVATGLVESRGAARRAVGEGGAYVNNAKVPDEGWTPGGRTCSRAVGSWCAGASATWPGSASPGLTRAVPGLIRDYTRNRPPVLTPPTCACNFLQVATAGSTTDRDRASGPESARGTRWPPGNDHRSGGWERVRARRFDTANWTG